MKSTFKLAVFACMLVLLTNVFNCSAQDTTAQTDTSHKPKPKPGEQKPPATNNDNDTKDYITLDLSTKPKLDYGRFKGGFARQNETYWILVKNYNPLRYRITANSTGSNSYMNTSNSLLTYVNTDAPSTPDKTNPPTAGSGTPEVQVTKANVKKTKKQIAEERANLHHNVDSIINLNADFLSIKDRLKQDAETIPQFYNQLNIFQAEIEKWKLLIDLKEKTVKDFRLNTYKSIADVIITMYTNQNIDQDPYSLRTSSDPQNHINSFVLLTFPDKAVNFLKADLDKFQTDLNTLDAFNNANKSQMNEICKQAKLPDYTNYRKYLVDIQTNYQKFVTDYNANFGKNLATLVTAISGTETLSFQTYFGPYMLEGFDEKTIKIGKLNILNNSDDEMKDYSGVLVKRHGGIKIDFSVGLFFSNLSDRSYVTSTSTRIVQDTTVSNGTVTSGPTQKTYSKILERKGGTMSYGPMAFIHFHSMDTTLFRYGIYLGTGFLFKDNSKPVLSLGGNLMLVNYQRLILGFGAVMGSVTRLSSQYSVNGSYPASITDVPTESHIEIKALVSLSWNLSK